MKTVLVMLVAALAAGVIVFALLPREAGTHTVVSPPEEVDVAGVDEEVAAAGTVEDVGFAIDGVVSEGEYPHRVQIAGIELSWANDDAQLRVGAVSPGTGYISVGFDPERRMEGANFVLGAATVDGDVVRDDYGTGAVAHAADVDLGGIDDILQSAVIEEQGRTTFEFVIPLDSGDDTDRPLVPGESYTVLVAYHATDDTFGARHTERGAGEITLDPAP